ncbi:putative GPI-anchored protein [Rosa sericea]
MASSKLSLFAFVLVQAFLLHSSLVYCNEEEDDLLQDLNSFRGSLNLTDFKENEKADCIADEISDELEDDPCSRAADYQIKPGNGPQFPYFTKLITKCDIDNSTTTDGIILPVCVLNLDPDLVLKNYTKTKFAQFLNDSKYTGAGVGSKDDWMIVVLTTDSHSGSFTGGGASLVATGMVHYMVALLLGLFLVLL